MRVTRDSRSIVQIRAIALLVAVVAVFPAVTIPIFQSSSCEAFRLSAQTPDEVLPEQTISPDVPAAPEASAASQAGRFGQGAVPEGKKLEVGSRLKRGRALLQASLAFMFRVAVLPGNFGKMLLKPLARWVIALERMLDELLREVLGTPVAGSGAPPTQTASATARPPSLPADDAPPSDVASGPATRPTPGPADGLGGATNPGPASGAGAVFQPGESTFPQGTRAASWERVWKRNGMDGSLSLRDLPGNGGRPVAVYLPPGFDPSRPARVITYFHGHNGNIGEAFRGNGVLARLRALAGNDPNTVFICPEAAQPPFGYWMRPPRESFDALQQQALGEAARLAGRAITVDKRVVSAHSGGGLALRNAVTSRQFAADRIEFLDSNYADWGAVVTRWARSQPAGNRPTIESWNTAGDTRRHDAEIKALAPDLVTINQSPVGHSAIPGRFLGSGLSR